MLASTIFISLASVAFASPVEKANPSEIAARQGFKGGWCGVHVHGIDVFDGENKGQRRGYIRIYDGEQWLVYESGEESVDKGSLTIEGQDGGMPEKLVVTLMPNGSDNPVANFVYGDQRWTSDADQCSVGNWDSTGLLPKNQHIDMDCGFSC